MAEKENHNLTPEQEQEKLNREFFVKSNFRSEITDYDKEVAHIPHYLWELTKADVIPSHVEFIKNYVKMWTVGEVRKSAPYGLILSGDDELCMQYMAIILMRVFMRRRSIYCESVFNLERECWDRDRLQELSEKVSLLAVHGFPFFLNGFPEGRDDLTVTLFHQMIFNRRNRELPTIFVSNFQIEEVERRYGALPKYIQNAIFKFSNPVEITRGLK